MLTRRALVAASLAAAACGPFARPARAEGRFALFVVDQGGARLLKIDIERETVAAAYELPSGPAALAASPDGRTIYMSLPETGQAAVFDVAAGRLLEPLYAGGEPFGLAVTEDEVILGDWSGAALTRALAAPTARRAARSPSAAPALLRDLARRRLYVVERDDATVGVVDLDGMTRVAGIAVGEGPFAIAASPDGATVYVASVRAGTVSILDAERLERVGEAACGGAPYGLAATPDGRALLVASQQSGALTRLAAGRLDTARRIRVGRYPEGVVVAPHTARAYVMNWFSGDISVIDLEAFAEVGRIRVGGGPRAGLCLGVPA
ncbi:YncE family protein [Methylocella sp.]|uniref:YncE family protein n=1 Tax=Methylocella sp. TaxID=1978226 RepID=UPI003783C76F